MGLSLKRSFSITPTVHETVFSGDSAIDLPRSNLPLWSRTADASHLALLPGKVPAVISYRGLSDPEMALLPRPVDGDQIHPLYFRAACRYGIVAIDDKSDPFVLETQHGRDGIRCLSPRALEALDRVTGPVHWIDALLSLSDSREVAGSQEDPSPLESKPLPVSLSFWLGVQIIAATFRARKDAL